MIQEFLVCESDRDHDPEFIRVDFYSNSKFKEDFENRLKNAGFRVFHVNATTFPRLLRKWYGIDVKAYDNDPIGVAYIRPADYTFFSLKWL